MIIADTGELYDVRELDGTAPYRYSILPYNMRVPSKARQLLGINEQPTRVPSKVAKVMGHVSEHQNVNDRNGAISGKAAKMLGITPMRKTASANDANWRDASSNRNGVNGSYNGTSSSNGGASGRRASNEGYAPAVVQRCTTLTSASVAVEPAVQHLLRAEELYIRYHSVLQPAWMEKNQHCYLARWWDTFASAQPITSATISSSVYHSKEHNSQAFLQPALASYCVHAVAYAELT
eukprot:11434-Heterococcus_DN1.PRE.1